MSGKPKLVSITSKKSDEKEDGVRANEALDKAKDVFSDDIIILGWGKDTGNLTFITCCTSKSEINYLLDVTKQTILVDNYE